MPAPSLIVGEVLMRHGRLWLCLLQDFTSGEGRLGKGEKECTIWGTTALAFEKYRGKSMQTVVVDVCY